VGGDASAAAAKRATTSIPIIFGMGSDPVEAGFVESMNRPAENATGWTFWTNQLEGKRIGLLRELVPGTPVIGVLLNPKFPPFKRQRQDVEAAARLVRQQVIIGRQATMPN
jgi:putative ABC transport system substrate-binding protein